MPPLKVLLSVLLLAVIVSLVDAKSIENAINNAEFHGLLLKVARNEHGENVYYHHIAKSLIRFLKLQHLFGLEMDFTADQVIDLVDIFQRVIWIKISLMERLLKIWSKLCDSETVLADELKIVMKQMACLNEFTSCVNLEVVAKRLSSPKMDRVVDAIEYLLPYAKEYAKKLNACDEDSVLIIR